ncbi:MAG: efflux RND transporter periplasmic adaptor subunit, partial [Gemmatimonadaceae bacterium]|nr:efflux RND transporter periplasmic adaptor subunit [Gemmatimonadaceae bacterium]
MRSIIPASVQVPLLLLAACRSGGDPMPMPAATVAVTTVAPQATEEVLDFVGQVEASRTVQVRAQASGVITARPFREGAQVHAGDVLYRIDATNYDADLRGARARVAEAESRVQNATVHAARLLPLIADNAVARQDVDNAEATLLQSRAALDDARATLARAQKSVSETVVRAEISGRVGRAL